GPRQRLPPGKDQCYNNCYNGTFQTMTRAVIDPSGSERFIFAGLRVLHEHGAAELTLRRVAQQAGSSTMGIYSCFGGRTGMLEAIYRRGFEMLEDAITNAPASADPRQTITAIAVAYRRFPPPQPPPLPLAVPRPPPPPPPP